VLLASPYYRRRLHQELQRIHEFVHAQGGVTMIDEIYLGLS
jgi:hypothetical protein